MAERVAAGLRPHAETVRTGSEGVPVQVHGKDGDQFFAEDLEAAQALVDSTDRAELFLYPGDEHLFADSSLPAYDAALRRCSASACWRSFTRSRPRGTEKAHRPH